MINDAYFKNKIILITGAAGGLGSELALFLAKYGAIVGVNDLSKEKAENLVSKIIARGGRAIAFPADVSKMKEVEEAVKTMKEKFGPVNILINNAAARIDFKRFEELSWDEFEKHSNVQVRGAFNTIKAVLQDMEIAGSGDIVNIVTQAASENPPAQFSGYVAAKFGLLGLTYSLAAELKNSKIRVNAISPGIMDTELVRNLSETHKDIMGRGSYSGRILSPAEAAREIVEILQRILSAEISGKNIVL